MGKPLSSFYCGAVYSSCCIFKFSHPKMKVLIKMLDRNEDTPCFLLLSVGIDIAYAANGYVYHTNYDTPAAVTPGSIQRAGDNILALVKTILNSPFLSDPGGYRHGDMVFFDFIGLFVTYYPERIGFVINTVTAVGVVLCLLSKFSGFLAKKRSHECKNVETVESQLNGMIRGIEALVQVIGIFEKLRVQKIGILLYIR